jgi:MOSC domain-containing protein YiiM
MDGPTTLRPDAPGPTGDRTRHRDLASLEQGLRDLPQLERDRGRVTLIVRRHHDGSREPLRDSYLTAEEGVPGDGWARRPPRDPEAQLAVMRHDVAELVANGQALTLFGDNLFVELDLTTANLPTGSRLQVGDAVVTVTPKPHNGCAKFNDRFGNAALRFVQAPATRDQNLRGVYWRVVTPGEVRINAPIHVLSRN